METQNNKDVAGPVLFAITITLVIIGIIWALS